MTSSGPYETSRSHTLLVVTSRMASSNYLSVDSLIEFEKFNANAGQVVLYFFASWYEPCHHITNVLKSLAADHPSIRVAQIEAEPNPEIASLYPVKSVPTCVLLLNGQTIHIVEGASSSELVQAVTKLTSTTSIAMSSTTSNSSDPKPAPPTPTESKDELFARLKSIIAKHRVMVFMKGNPAAPRCGFSRQMVEILQAEHVEFDTFDILTDEAARQGLKEYSNWPTYPQLYVDNNLVGGLDLVKELKANEELASVFQ